MQADVEHTFLSPFFFFLETNEKSADKLEIWANFIALPLLKTIKYLIICYVVINYITNHYLNVLKIEKVDLSNN